MRIVQRSPMISIVRPTGHEFRGRFAGDLEGTPLIIGHAQLEANGPMPASRDLTTTLLVTTIPKVTRRCSHA